MKHLAERSWFALCAVILNLAVGVMFHTVSTRPPIVLANSPGFAVSQESSVASPQIVPATQGIPVRIVIPSLALDLTVGVGSYDPADGSWTLDEVRAFYADTSVPANDSNGHTLIYGHAQAPVFASLANLPADAVAEVYTDNGNLFRYVYTSTREVVPTDTSVFKSDGPPALVLQTCTGPWDAYRALHSFRLESVRKI